MKIKHIKINNFQNIGKLDEDVEDINLIQYKNLSVENLGGHSFYNAIKWVFGKYYLPITKTVLLNDNLTIGELASINLHRKSEDIYLYKEKNENFEPINVNVELIYEDCGKEHCLKRDAQFNDKGIIIHDNLYLNNKLIDFNLLKHYPIKHYIREEQCFDIKKNDYSSMEYYDLQKLNEIAKSIKNPTYKNLYIKYNDGKMLQWHNKKDNKLFSDGHYSESERNMLYLYDFIIKCKYNIAPIILMFDEFNIDRANLSFVLKNIRKLLSNQIFFAGKAQNNIGRLEMYLKNEKFKIIKLDL